MMDKDSNATADNDSALDKKEAMDVSSASDKEGMTPNPPEA